MYRIYKITSPEGKVYIGQTKNMLERRHQYGCGYKSNTLLWNDIVKYGWNAFTDKVIERVETKEEALLREAYWISYYKSDEPSRGYNTHTNHSTLARLLPKQPKYLLEETGETFFTLEEVGQKIERTAAAICKAIKQHRSCNGFHILRLE